MNVRNRLSTAFRNRRAALLRHVIAKIASEQDTVSILDVGGRVQYWEQIGLEFLSANRASVTLLNLTSEEMAGSNIGPFRLAIGDACRLDYPDKSFDLVHSNSVIEHVESWRNMKAFASEAMRVGRSYFIQTPNFWFPIDPHYYALPMIHWLPRPWQASLLSALPLATSGRMKGIDKSFSTLEGTKLLTSGQMRFLFPDGKLVVERLAGLPKSLTMVR